MVKTEQEIFVEALAHDRGPARERFLDQACGEDATLRTRLDELLTQHDSQDSLLDQRPRDLVESLAGAGEAADGAGAQDLAVVLAALEPFLGPPNRADSLGSLAHYELLEVLGQGGHGVVFKGFDPRLERPVAIKILAPHLAVASPPRRRFLREAKAAAAVRHEHVVQIYAVEELPIPYLVMEFVPGETLQQRSDRIGPLEPSEVVRLGMQIASGLAAAHEQGLIHRDIKPGNILVQDGIEPLAKLSDFGLARTADDASLSQSGAVIGTPMYMSPEQVHGDALDQRSDLFSLGSVLYLMTTGRPPFRARNTMAVLRRVAEDEPRPVRDVISDTPIGLSEVLARLQRKSPDERFASAKEVETALAVCLTNPAPSSMRRAQRRTATMAIGVLASVSLLLVASEFFGLTDLGRRAGWWNRAGQTEPSSAVVVAYKPVVESAGDPASESSADALPEVSANPATSTRAEATPVAESPADDSRPPNGSPPWSDWENQVASLPAEQRVTEVIDMLCQRNPELNRSHIQPRIADGAVVELTITPSDKLVDLSPVRGFRQLKSLRLFRGGGVSDLRPLRGLMLERIEMVDHPVSDLSPLTGMPLTYFGFWGWRGEDLSPLRGMALTAGNFGASQVRDLEPLRGMKLVSVCFNLSKVEDLSPLAGMPLKFLEVENTRVTDLTPIAAAPLELLRTAGSPINDYSLLRGTGLTELSLDYDPARDEPLLRSLPNLKTVNRLPVAEVLK